MNIKIIIFIFFFFVQSGCKTNKTDKNKISIYQLHPYFFEDTSIINDKLHHDKIRYYILDGNTANVKYLSTFIHRFIKDSIKNEFEKFNNYQIMFFKSRKGFDKNYVTTPKDFIDHHGDDLLANFGWYNGHLSLDAFYKNGEQLYEFEDVKLSDP